jgi:hypothetical protein
VVQQDLFRRNFWAKRKDNTHKLHPYTRADQKMNNDIMEMEKVVVAVPILERKHVASHWEFQGTYSRDERKHIRAGYKHQDYSNGGRYTTG